ncbi:MAG: hypothetical protein RLN75_05305, partial [Longimicrobiales bacterium]
DRLRASGEIEPRLEDRDVVLDEYGAVFSPEGIRELTPETFKGFLVFRNNRHWRSIHRQGGQIVSDMDALKEALLLLIDESIPLGERLSRLRPKNGEPMIKGLARSVITPILLVAYPDRYGVLNQVAETAMQQLGVWPDLSAGADFATKYQRVNAVLNELARRLEIDLWTLDGLWADVRPEVEDDEDEVAVLPEPEDVGYHAFGLEAHLHEFLYDNWDQTELGQDWALLEDEGEVIGFKYNTRTVGEIDLLAHHRSEPRWLVIELKRDRTSDRAVGQALRYRGWVKRHLAEPGETVEAVIIGLRTDPKLMYAIDGLEGVSALTYSVRFAVHEPSVPWEGGDGVG